MSDGEHRPGLALLAERAQQVPVLRGEVAVQSRWSRRSTAELRARRAELLAGLPPADRLLPGALIEQHRNCGKEGCRCTRGEPHGPYVYLQVAERLMYVPSGLAETVRSHVELSVGCASRWGRSRGSTSSCCPAASWTSR